MSASRVLWPVAGLLLTSPIAAQTEASVTAVLEEVQVRTGTPGISAAVSHEGRIVFSGGAGFADLNHRIPATGTTVHNVGSVSKVIAAVGLMALVEDGRVDLGAKIQTYVPSFPEKQKPITVRHVLTHTSGIRHYRRGDFPNGFENMKRYRTIEDSIAIFKDDALLFDPGAAWSYSSFASNLVGGIVEAGSGEGFESFLRERVWEPAGMLRTSFDVPERVVRDRARAYMRATATQARVLGVEAGALVHVPYGDVSYKWAGGGILSTAEDLVRLCSALNAGKLLRKATRRLMYTPPFEKLERWGGAAGQRLAFGQALFWRIGRDAAGRRTISHGGSVKGFKTHLVNFPDQRLVVAVIGNTRGFQPRPTAMRLAAFYLGQ